jgi:GT2 family glycosyltransferase
MVLHVLLPVHNRREVTSCFVSCLAQQSFRDFHLLLIDDGSTDGTADMVCATLAGTTVLRGDGSWWWGGALQRGYDWVKRHAVEEDLVLVINDDTEFEPDFLETGIQLLDTLPGTFLLSACYDRENGSFLDAGVTVEWNKLKFFPSEPGLAPDCLSTRGLFMRMTDFVATGGFRPRLLPHYLSDYEFTIRARNRGITLSTSDRLRLWVDNKATGNHDRVTFSTIFSKRSARNPLAWTAFLLLCCPAVFVPINLARVWGATVYGLLKTLRRR